MAVPSPQSRRDRPAKPSLSKAWIVDAALHILQEEGLEHVTMRRVAQALDTGPASLYVYIANTAALHAELLDRVLVTLALPQTGEWQERLIAFLVGYGEVLMRLPGLARSALTSRPTGPHYLRVYEVTAELLVEGGVSIAQALWGADLLVLHMTAAAAEHAAPPVTADRDAGPSHLAHLDELRGVLARSPEVPLLHAHPEVLFGGTPQERQRWQLQVLLAGLFQVPLPPLNSQE